MIAKHFLATILVKLFKSWRSIMKRHLKVPLGPETILITESPLNIMKNAFCFTLKALFVLKIFNFLS